MSSSSATSTPSSAAVGWEELPWVVDPAAAAMSRGSRLAARGPYLAAVPARLASASIALPAAVAAEAEDALMEISRFDAELSAALPAPGDEAGELAPLTAVLLRAESASSSRIENVTAGAKALALATLHEKAGVNAELVAANVEAMRVAVEMSEALSVETVLSVRRALMAGHEHAGPGRFRTGPVWIGGGPSPHTATFVPPAAERVGEGMADLLTFCTRTDLPVLVHAAIAHAQFEAIHPFADGTGRTGRVLVHAMLRAAGATTRMTVPVSAGLPTDTGSYFDALTAYRDGDPAPIVARFTDAAFAAVTRGRELAAELATIHSRWAGELTARKDASVWAVLPMLVRQPAVTVRWVQDHARVSQPAAQRAVDQLLEAGVLTPVSANRRNRVWMAPEVLNALDAFTAAGGHR